MIHRVSYTGKDGNAYSFVFQLYWDATRYAMRIEKDGATDIIISEDTDD